MRQFERKYRLKTGEDLGQPETLNKRFEDIDVRTHALEEALQDVNEVAARVEGAAVDRINTIVTPLAAEAIERLQAVSEIFRATSATEATIGLGARTFYVDANQRNTFAALEWVHVVPTGDAAKGMIGSVTSFNRASGELILNVAQIAGGGTFSSWTMYISAPPELGHASRTDNPHATTAAQVGAYTIAAVDTLLAAINAAIAAKADAAATTTSLAAKAPLANPAFTGTPTAPTAAAGTNTTQIATMAAVQTAIANLLASSPAQLDTLNELAAALGNDANFATTINAGLAARLRFDAAQGLSAAQQLQARANIAASPLIAVAPANMILNSDMAISQEFADTSTTLAAGAVAYKVDQWVHYNGGTMATSHQRVTDAPPGFDYSFKTIVTTAQPALGVNDIMRTYQPIERMTMTRLALGTASAAVSILGGWVKSPVTGIYSVGISSLNGAAVDASWLGQITINQANTWEYKTVAVPASALGTWGTSLTGAGCVVGITLAAGTNMVGVGGWQAGDKRALAGQVNLASAVNNAFQHVGWGWLSGSEFPDQASSPLMRPHPTLSLRMCQRYFQECLSSINIGVASGGTWSTPVPFFVPMRATPSWQIIGGYSGGITWEAMEDVYSIGARHTVTLAASSTGFAVARTVRLSARM